jgi:hypothetical protein
MGNPATAAQQGEATQLIHFPNELLILIFQEAPCNDLVSLAAVSHRLHDLALEVLFKRHNIDTTSKDISLGLKHNTIGGLPGLAIALSVANASLTHLHCDLTTKFDSPTTMIREARELTRFVSKLAGVQQVSLQLMHPLISEWEEVLLELLDTILLKSCTSLSVKNLESSTYSGGERSEPPFPPLAWPASAVLACFRYFFEKPRPISRLTSCNIQTLPRFLIPFYENALNTSSITSLSFKHIFNAKEWAAFSEKIYLPNLEHLAITHGALNTQSLETFLIRHSSIVSLDLRHNSLMPLHPPRLPRGILPRLAKLQTSPDYLTRYFPDMGTFPAMVSIISSIGNRHHRTGDFMACIGTCRNGITLSLTIGYRISLEPWLREEISRWSMEPTGNLHCVKALELDNGPHQPGFGDTTLALIAQWLALFPAVEHITIHRRCFLDPSKSSELFFQRLKEALVPRNFDYNTTLAGLDISEHRSV